MVEVLFEIDACNLGSVTLALDAVRFDISGVGAPSVDAEIVQGSGMISASECSRTSAFAGLEVCMDSQYTATMKVVARPLDGGALCEGDDDLTIGWEVR